jgi:hypothetical protein
VRKVALIGAVVALFIPAVGSAQENPPAPEGGAESVQTGALSRADSLRALVLERVRASQELQDAEGEEAPEEGGEDSGVGGAGVAGRPTPPSPPGSTQAGSGESTRITVPSGADPFMEGLLQLEGATVSSYEGTRVDFEVARRNLILWGDEERGARFFGQGWCLWPRWRRMIIPASPRDKASRAP